MTLPTPSDDALNHSNQLLLRIREKLAAEPWLSFASYMSTALYEPGLGYYSGGSTKFGPGGDFITAPELTPLFGQTLATQLADVLPHCGEQIIEVGAGTGLLAADLLTELERLDCLPASYQILELSGELRSRQFDTLAERVPQLAERVKWLDHLPQSFSGVVLANEVLDVMPVHLVACRNGCIFERGLALGDGERLAWADRPAEGRVLEAAKALDLPQPVEGEYVTEINLAGAAWIAEWAQRMKQGLLLLVDYGYPRAEYYLPSRSNGTLLCYYRHHAHADPLLWPGLNDITAFVDFTSIADAAFDAGFEVRGYTTQASFLFNCGLLEVLERRGPREGADYIRAARAAQRLTAPQEMGELFKVMALTKQLPIPLRGFARGDRLHAL